MLTLVKRPDKELPGKANSSTFVQLNCCNSRLNVGGLNFRSAKILKHIKFEEISGELEGKKYFQ